MSRNFALLHKAGKEALLSVPSPIEPPPLEVGIRHLTDLAPDREASTAEHEDHALQHDIVFPTLEEAPQGMDENMAIEAEAVQLKVESRVRRFDTEPIPNGRRNPRLHLAKAAQEQVVKLVQRVFIIPKSVGPRVVVFASVDQGHESGEICCHAGDVLATQVSGSICLVDANFRAPLLHQLLGVHRSPGVADAALSSGSIRDFAVRIAGNLWIVPPGSGDAKFPGLFSSSRWQLRMEELRQSFDYVLIDAPPVSYEADTVLLGQRADGVILVLEANSTRREDARKAKATLQEPNVKLLGAILNNRTFPVPEAIYRKL